MNELLIYAAAGCCAGIFFFFKGFKKFWKKRLIQNIPTSRVRSLAMGLVELSGRSVPDVILTAPYSGAECVFYHIIAERLVDRYTRHGRTRQWVKEYEMKTDIPFFIEDDTGSVAVDPRGASLDLSLNYSRVDHPMRYSEYVIRAGEGIYVLGTAQRMASIEDKMATEVEERLRAIAENPDEKIKLDTNNDMWIDESEWQAARDRLREEVRADFSHAEEMARQAHKVPGRLADVVISRGALERYFILSSRSEKELLAHYGRKVSLYVFGGALLAVVSLAAIIFLL